MAFGAALVGANVAHAATLAISCGAVGQELELCKTGAEAWAKKTGNQINLISTPNSATERLALYQQLLAAGAADVDVFQIDIVWPGILSNHFIDLSAQAKDVLNNYFPAIVKNNTVDGKLVAMPWFTDAGLLYYRKDLLAKYNVQPPQTWQELTDIAKKIQDGERAAGNDKMWGFVWQGRAYEGLTCNAMEWVASYNGGTIVDEKGKVTIDNPQAATAITAAAGWVKTISPEGVLNYTEEEARGVFQSGNAVFMRNWPYVWSLAQGPESAIKDKVGVSVLPKGGADGRYAATLGGWQLAVSKYSKNKELATDLVMYLTSSEEQKRRAIQGAFNPTIEALYKDPEVLKAAPFMGELYDTFVNAIARPSTATGTKYNQVSNEFWNAVHEVLSGSAKADANLAKLASSLKRMSRGGRQW
ncbi:MAG: ABC transporter substrate-binding protein [Phycisphaerales bacterium]|nr:ABC transporter substrate-binding protein [Phycisphaerales bacterium]